MKCIYISFDHFLVTSVTLVTFLLYTQLHYGVVMFYLALICLWNGEFGFEVKFYLASFPGLLADCFTVCKNKNAHLHHDRTEY